MPSSAVLADVQLAKRSAAGEQPVDRRPTNIDDLPDELIVSILAQSKVCGCGAYIFPYVNQRFRRLFSQPTAVWRDTSLCAWRDGPRRRGSNAADHTLRRLRWLCPRATAIQNIDLHGWAGPQADQLFATLTGMLAAGDPVLRISAYDCEFTGRAFDSLLLLPKLQASAFDSLLLLPKLQALELGPVGGSVEAGHLGMLLGSLRHLTSLDLDFEWTEKGSVKGGFPTGLLDCTRLRRLCLSNAGDAAFRALPPEISQLQALDHLILYDCGVARVPAELSSLTRLTRLGIFQFQGPAADVCPLVLPQAMTALKSLRELGLSLPAWQPMLKAFTGQLSRLMVRHISTHAEAHTFASAFWHLKAAKTLELCSDTDLATDSKDAFQVIRWATPEVEFY